MTFFAYQGVMTAPAGTGNSATTAPGFAPKAVIFWTDAATASGDAADLWGSFGFGDGTGAHSFCSFWAFTNNVSTTAFSRGDVSGSCVAVNNGAGTSLLRASLSAFSASGFTLNYSVNTVSGTIIHYLAIGGTDITNVLSGTFLSPTATGNQATSTVGFQPDLLMFVTGAQAPMIGVAMSSTDRFACSLSATSGATKSTANTSSRIQDMTHCIASLQVGGGTSFANVADLVSMDATGFTLNFTTVLASAQTTGYLAIKGGTYGAGSFTKGANTTDTTVTVDAGLTATPVAYLMIGAVSTTNTAQSTGARFTMGGTDGTRWDSATTENKNGVIPTQARRYSDAGAGANSVYRQRALPASTTTAGADEVIFAHSAFTATGFTLSYTTNATATAYVFPYVTFGPVAAAPPAAQQMLTLLGVGV